MRVWNTVGDGTPGAIFLTSVRQEADQAMERKQ